MPRCDLSRSEVTIQLLLHAWSHRQQWPMWHGRQLHAYGIAGPNVALGDHDAHDSSLANQIAVRIPVQRCGHQVYLEIVDLDAGIAQAGDFDNGACAKMQPRAGWQGQQIDAGCGDVLAKLAGLNGKAFGAQLVEQFSVNQMHLTQIGLRRVLADARAVLHRLAHMAVAGDTQSPKQANAEARRLAEVMTGAKADRCDAAHGYRFG